MAYKNKSKRLKRLFKYLNYKNLIIIRKNNKMKKPFKNNIKSIIFLIQRKSNRQQANNNQINNKLIK